MIEKSTQTNVVYVEDNPANLKLVEQVLARIDGLKLYSAPNGIIGLNLAETYQPKLILLDINLPGMDGYEIVKKIKESPVLRHIPVVAISANAMPADIEKGQQAGFDDYLTKPVDIVQLLEVVNRYISA